MISPQYPANGQKLNETALSLRAFKSALPYAQVSLVILVIIEPHSSKSTILRHFPDELGTNSQSLDMYRVPGNASLVKRPCATNVSCLD